LQNNTFSTLFVGQNLIKLSAVDSTNNFLKSLLSNSTPITEGTVIMADHQFAGRGQHQNIWHAEPGKNLTVSILLKPTSILIKDQFVLNIIVSIAICKVLSTLVGKEIKVKWPNDIYFGNKKLGGILIENTIAGNTIKTAVVGIGINVNQQHFGEELSQKATSIYQILRKEIDLKHLLELICKQIEENYLALEDNDYTFLKQNYVEQLYQINQLKSYRHKHVEFQGVIRGVADDGRLIVEYEGNLRYFNFKEVEFLADA